MMDFHALLRCYLTFNFLALVSGYFNYEVDLPDMNIFGHPIARAGLQVVKQQLAQTPKFTNKNLSKRTIGTPSVNKHKKCGPQSNGTISFCQPGDW